MKKSEPLVSEKITNYVRKLAVYLLIFGIVCLGLVYLRKALFGKPSAIANTNVSSFPDCADSVNVWVNEKQPTGRQTVWENCLSGIVLLPLNTRFISDAPGWVEYWFITPAGYKVIKVADREARFPRTKMPSCTFRMRGKQGTAKIQMELRNSRQMEYNASSEDNTEPIR